MSTDFFERQERARQNTGRLVVLFTIAVLLIVATTSTIAFAAASSQKLRGSEAIGAAFAVGLITLAMIVIGTLYKVVSLRSGGGRSVAEAVGGLQLTPNMSGVAERRVMNVVEEMAIASGTPVPPVFLLDEPSINAFAAGYSPSDAVIGVTRGAVDNLSRDQLQGVIAHEFSHILNGDMRMNIRLIGILHGILLLHLIGGTLLRMLRFSGGSRRSGKNNGGGQAILVIVGIGLALYILGYIGSVFGGLIKAAVSRQREYLADASAVQFTRNPAGIGGALKKIGGLAKGSTIEHPGAELASHMYFAKGVYEGFTGMMATHPPLEKRIAVIDPSWDGKFPAVDGRPRAAKPSPTRPPVPELGVGFAAASAPVVAAPVVAAPVVRSEEVPVELVRDAADHIGAPQEAHRQYAAKLVSEIHPTLVQAAHEPYSARALVFALLLDADKGIRRRQLEGIGRLVEPHLVVQTQQLSKLTDGLSARARLPLLDMTLPALRTMSPPQYVAFMRAFAQLADADDRHTVFEWTLAQILIRHLKPQFVAVRSPVTLYYSLKGLTPSISVLLSTMARVGHGREWYEPAFQAGRKELGNIPVTLLDRSECTLNSLNESLKKLSRATAKLRGRLVDACAVAIAADGHVKVSEAELLRGIADLLDCPVPPWIRKS